jgi:hypothetical protein
MLEIMHAITNNWEMCVISVSLYFLGANLFVSLANLKMNKKRFCSLRTFPQIGIIYFMVAGLVFGPIIGAVFGTDDELINRLVGGLLAGFIGGLIWGWIYEFKE